MSTYAKTPGGPSRESHGHQELSRVNKVELRGVKKVHVAFAA
jgi:hypothetical protein